MFQTLSGELRTIKLLITEFHCLGFTALISKNRLFISCELLIFDLIAKLSAF